MTISVLELRHIIESGFLPLQCTCSPTSGGEMTIKVTDLLSGENLVVAGISIAGLETSKAISELIARLRLEFIRQHQ